MSGTSPNTSPLPLEGIRVLELASVLAGPLAGTDLAVRGASVTKVERPPHGDVTRSWRTPSEPAVFDADGHPASAYWAAANWGKTVAWVDLTTTAGAAWLEDALATHDVVIQNFKAADLAKFNLSPTDVSARHPHLIHVRLVGFRHQPERLAYDVVVQAETGWMHMNGAPGSVPTRMPVALMDVLASHAIREAVLEGLYTRLRDGNNKGAYREISLESCGLAALANQATNHLIGGQSPGASGNEHPNIAPYGDLLCCSDGHVVLAIGSNRQFAALCEVLRLPEIATDPAYRTNAERVTHRSALLDRLNAQSQGWKKSQLVDALTAAGAPAGVVRTLPEVFQAVSGADVLLEDASGRRVAP